MAARVSSCACRRGSERAQARAKGAAENRILYGHIFRNAMLLIIAGFPAAFISILFTGALDMMVRMLLTRIFALFRPARLEAA